MALLSYHSYFASLCENTFSHTFQTRFSTKYLLSCLWDLCFGNATDTPTVSLRDCLLYNSPRHSQHVKKVAAIPSTCKWNHIQGLDNHLVTSCGGATKQMLFWNQTSSGWSNTDKQGSSWDYPSFLHSSSFDIDGSKKNILVTGTWERNICLWSEDGEILYQEKSAHEDSILSMCSWDNYIASADFSGTIKIWKLHKEGTEIRLSLDSSKALHTKIYSLLALQDGDSCKLVIAGSEVVVWDISQQQTQILKGYSTLYAYLCRFHNWIAAGTLEGNLYLWNLNGTLEKKLEVGEYIISLQTWGKYLCVGLGSRVLLWEPTENTVSQLQGSHSMAVFKDKLVTCTEKEVLIYEAHVGWEVQKLLWVGNLKGEVEDCSLAVLPPEMVCKVLSFL